MNADVRLLRPPTRAELLERLAGQVLEDRIPDRCLPAMLRELAPALPTDEERLETFEDLVEGIVLRDGIEDGTLHWCQVLPDAAGDDRDTQALEQARTRVADALAKLAGA